MKGQVNPFVDLVTAIDADLTILTNAGGAPWDPRVREWLGGNERVQMMRPFGILTKLPIIEQRWLARQDDIAMVLLIVDAEQALGRELVIYLIDMPSNPNLGRAKLAATARRLIDEATAPPPDMIVGDPNMTRGSAALRSIAPHMHHAFSEGGHGYGATYHRRFPLYHIDHILLDNSLRCVRYDVRPAEIGRHRPQVAWIVNDVS
jgi:endonuclease/exonuclease/phosphatase family metal-dependent hydrolase